MAMLPSAGTPDWSVGSLPPAACAAADVFNNDVTFIWSLLSRISVTSISLTHMIRG